LLDDVLGVLACVGCWEKFRVVEPIEMHPVDYTVMHAQRELLATDPDVDILEVLDTIFLEVPSFILLVSLVVRRDDEHILVHLG
jgi:hypothetical protein